MNSQQLFEQIKLKGSFLCVGLDPDLSKMPRFLVDAVGAGRVSLGDVIFEFNRAIIDATAQYTVCYKPNLAFYECYGLQGWSAYERTVAYIRANYSDIFVIADAKRGDIGNTSGMYAKAFFEGSDSFAAGVADCLDCLDSQDCLDCRVDGVTLSPYMGRDTVMPFLEYEGRWAVVLALTSNGSASDFELQPLAGGEALYQQVLRTAAGRGTVDNTMFVIGATKAEALTDVRSIVPDHFLLVPGVGAQGGSLAEVAKYGMNSRCGLLVNSSRGILYAYRDAAADTFHAVGADDGRDFAAASGAAASKLQTEMAEYLRAAGLI